MNVSTKEKIKNVALEIFAEKGYEATSLHEIADGVGIKKPSLYAHFSSKDEIFLAVFLDLANEYKAVVQKICNNANSKEKIEDALYYVFENYITYFLNNPQKSSFWNRVLFFTPTELYEKVFKIAAESDSDFHRFLKKKFEDGILHGLLRGGSVEDMMLSYSCLRSGLLAFLHIDKGFKPDRIKAVWDYYWSGIKG